MEIDLYAKAIRDFEYWKKQETKLLKKRYSKFLLT